MPSHLRGILALLIVTAAWGTTFPAMKELTGDFSSAWIVCIRFSIAGFLLSPFLLRAKYIDVAAGALMGSILLVCYLLQLEGLARTSSNRNAFIIGLNVLIVPLLDCVVGRLPERRIVLAILLALAGLFALCWDGGAWGGGDNYALAGALAFGIYIKLMEVMTRRVSNLMSFTTVQILTVALCAGSWLLFASQGHLDWNNIQTGMTRHLGNLIYLSLVATIGIMSLQAWGQRHCSANEAAVIYAIEPACAAVAAYFWLDETMAGRGVLGGVLMIAGMIVSQWHAKHRSTEPIS